MPALADHSCTYRHRCLPDRIHSCLHEEYLLFSMLECQKSYNSSISHPVKYQPSDNSYSVFRLSSTADSQLASLSAARHSIFHISSTADSQHASLSAARHFIFHISTVADFSLASLSAARKSPRYHPAPGQSSSSSAISGNR
ncbi:Uncharacterised protein [uncultured Clostridium sp.]|nr:Uncharacterised protein [uncultured Clostridium sp.]